MTERARDKDGKRQEREGERQQVETHRGPQAGGTERQAEREREAETQREGERKRERQRTNKGQGGRWEQVSKGRGRDRDGQRPADVKQRKQLQTNGRRQSVTLWCLSRLSDPLAHVRPRGTSSALTYPPPQHVAGLHIQDTPRPPTSACVSPLGKSRPHVCPEAQAPSVCPPISAHFLDCLSSQ